MRDYGTAGQLGLEKTPEEYLEKMVAVFWEVRRVLRKDGTLWLNMGDSYMANCSNQNPQTKEHKGAGFCGPNRKAQTGLKPKDLCGMPWRLALALQADGWWLRSDIIWEKGNPMPQSVTDRPSTSHEYIFLLTKSARYYFDADAIREEVSGTANRRGKKDGTPPSMDFKMQEPGQGNRNNSSFQSYMKDLPPEAGRNCRSVWHINSAPFPSAHFGTFSPALPERCIKAGTSERGCCPSCFSPYRRVVEKSGGTTGKDWNRHTRGENDLKIGATKNEKTYDGTYRVESIGWAPTCACNAGEPIPCTVLDPFAGASTTLLVAAKLGRDAVGLELSPEYCTMSLKRLRGELGMLATVEIK